MSEFEQAQGTSGFGLEVYEAIVENAPIGIYIVQDGQIQYGNRWLREVSGYGFADLPRPALDVIHPDDRPLVVDQMRRRLSGDAPRPSYPVRFLTRAGRIVHMELIAQVVAYRGRPAIQGSLVDVSDRVEAERRLQDYTAHLEEANRYRQLFADIISNDLLNPVWVVQNFLQLVLDEGVSDHQRTMLGRALETLERARDVLQDARIYLRLQEPRRLSMQRLDLGELIEAAVRGQQPLLEHRGVRVDVRLPGPISVMGSASLREVFSNLLANAIEHSPVGATVEVAAGGSELVRVEVRDRGPGIPQGDRERVFRRFVRLAGRNGGVGLGLAIVKVLVDLHGGRVWVEDNPGGGSVFCVELPTAMRRSGDRAHQD